MSVFFPRRWGNVPSTTPGGFRSVFMRQIGGLGSPSGVIPPSPPPPSVGSSISGGTFSRGRWRALREAQHAAEVRAQETGQRKRKKALDEAAAAAALALSALREEEVERQAIETNATAMRHALEAATGSNRLATVIRQSNRVVELAKAIIQQIEDDEEEEEIIEMAAMGLLN